MMRPIAEAQFALIDITYHCGRKCVYCTRNDRHLGDKRYDMTIPEIKAALEGYLGYPGLIGIIGGEPLIHPDFDEICHVIQQYYPADKMHLFTAINPYVGRKSEIIKSTFRHIAYHEHSKDQESAFYHQPLTIAIKDVIKNPALKERLIDDCWVQRKWCPTITNDGAFFCEAGASIAKLAGIKGWPVVSGWWKREPKDFGYQMSICDLCGMCIPMHRQKMEDKVQKISPTFLKILNDNNLPTGEYELFDREITIEELKEAAPDWKPGIYKAEQLTETFQFSTIDFSIYENRN